MSTPIVNPALAANPLVWVGALGLVFWLGRRSGKKSAGKGVAKAPPIPAPTPLPLPPAPAPEGKGLDYRDAWASVSYGYQVFPSGASPAPVPPPGPASARADAPCDVIVVTDGWWDHVGTFVKKTVAAGGVVPVQLSAEIVAHQLPGCAVAETLAVKELRGQIRARIESYMAGLSDGMLDEPGAPADPYAIDLELSPTAKVMHRFRPGVGHHAIVVEGKNVYHPAIGHHVHTIVWRAWKPGPVTEGTHFAEGTAATRQQALTEAFAAIDTYPIAELIEINPTRRRRRRFGGRIAALG